MRKLIATSASLASAVALTALVTGTAVGSTSDQTGRLYELQAAFHRAASVRDNVNGDTQLVIDARIRDMLKLWTDDGSLTLSVGSPFDGQYVGRGNLDPAGCPSPSASADNRGTVCTFFRYVAGSFKIQNKLVSLAPSYKTHFEVHGNTASVYYECHYFNVALGADGKPLWAPVSHVEATGTASLVNGRWKFKHLDAPVPPVPLGS